MKTYELTDRLYWTGVLDSELRVFDIVMMTEFGTTYNSYILKGSEKTALFETAKLKFWDDYKSSVESIAAISDIDYIVMNHTEPDHAGSIEKLLEINPKIQIVGTGTAISFLKEIVNHEFYSIIVKNGDTLSLGDKTLNFMILPNLHWPDTMYTYVPEDKVLFTCDSFGSHFSHDGVVRSTVKDEEGYLRATKYYFDNIIGPYKNPYMKNAMECIKDLDIKMICPGHGPVLDSGIDQIMAWYKEWCKLPEKGDSKSVVIPYVSAYGYTAELAEKISEGIKASGNINVALYDMVTADSAAVSAEITAADGVLFGTPTIVGEALAPIWNLTTSMFPPVHKGKLASAFGSYGWSGEGVPHIIERLKQLKLKVIDDGFRIRFKPSDVQLMDAYDYGYNFGCILLDKENDRTAKKDGGRKLVKCMVCGEIFDASLGACPVCGVGPDKFIEVEDTDTGFKKDSDERFLIIGGGAGAYNAAKAIRERNETCLITIISAENELPYNRPMLTKALLADFSDNQFAISGPDWYEENRVITVLGTTVEKIDVQGKKVICGNESFAYDKLIYALGAKCFVAPINGSTQEHVISIRSIADAQNVQKRLNGVKNVVVIGGGVMGLESAWEIKKGGYDVTVLETAPRLLPKQLDEGASEMLSKVMEKAGVKHLTGAKITEIGTDAVKLEDGTSFPAQLVILSTGMRPNLDVAKDAGIKIDKLIEVDSHMNTNENGIYSCGDCTQFEGAQNAFWSQAVETGRVAGANAAGDTEVEYSAISSSMVINAMDTSIFSLGDNGSNPDKQYRTVEIKDEKRLTYEKYYFFNNRLDGVMLIGDTSRMTELTKAVEAHSTFNEVIK